MDTSTLVNYRPLLQSRSIHHPAFVPTKSSVTNSWRNHGYTPLLILALLLIAVSPATSAPPVSSKTQFAQRPYMGWSSWSFFRDHPSEAIVKEQANALLANGLLALGYRYVNIDDGWSDGFDDHGIPKPNLQRFPSGMDGMAKYLHQHGLLFGIYLNPGITEKLYQQNPVIEGTTAHIADITDTSQAGSTRRNSYRIDFTKPAAAAYIQSQVKQFDMWGIDFIKFDFVGPGGGNVPADNREELRQWHAAIAHASHPIWLELSNFLSIDQASLWRTTSNGWRIENDIECYGCDKATDSTKGNLTQWSKVAERFADVVPWIPYAGRDEKGDSGWNDLDTLELGNGDKDGLTPAERQSMFTLWAISCAPLYLGSDLTKVDPTDLALISNKEIIAIDQAGIPAHPLDIQHLRNKPQQAWLTIYPNGSVVLALFNLASEAAEVKVSWHEIDALRDTHLAGGTVPPKLHDLISAIDMVSQPDGLTIHLGSHASRIFHIPLPH
jgi:alpha-galactosidase